MSWLQKLYETYEHCAGKEAPGDNPLPPICHTTQQAHIEIVLDREGNFSRAALIPKENAETLIPATESSSGRAGSKPTSHPLCDKLQYVAADFCAYGGVVTSGFLGAPQAPHQEYLANLRAWAAFDPQEKLASILAYVEKGAVVKDLIAVNLLPADSANKLITEWPGDKESRPGIFRTVGNTQSPQDAFVRWRVQGTHEAAGTWQDTGLINSWISFYQQGQTKKGFCQVTCDESALALQHPAKLRHGADRAKLISSNDTDGFTFRGRLTGDDADLVASVSFDVTQKAHNALRWLIEKQAYSNGSQRIITWAVSGHPVPDAFGDSSVFLDGLASESHTPLYADTAQAFATQLNNAIAGYRANIDPSEEIVTMALDSASTGRMAIQFYRILRGTEFLDRIAAWHARFAWFQNFGKNKRFIGAPAPKDIAESAYGSRIDDKLRRATVERLLPCIIDSAPIPRDLVFSAVRRAANRAGFKKDEAWLWEKVLGVACGLFRGLYPERNYQMALEPERRSRDYLFGRLLAVADNIEQYALTIGGETRDTSAARLMQRFADRPASTWRTIAIALRPYMSRLRANEKGAGFLVKRERLLDEITCAFQPAEFTNPAPLSGEFLLGFHCQRRALFTRSVESGEASAADASSQNSGENN